MSIAPRRTVIRFHFLRKGMILSLLSAEKTSIKNFGLVSYYADLLITILSLSPFLKFDDKPQRNYIKNI
jgi:hypothetical protein